MTVTKESFRMMVNLKYPSRELDRPVEKVMFGWHNGADHYFECVPYKDAAAFMADFFANYPNHGLIVAEIIDVVCKNG